MPRPFNKGLDPRRIRRRTFSDQNLTGFKMRYDRPNSPRGAVGETTQRGNNLLAVARPNQPSGALEGIEPRVEEVALGRSNFFHVDPVDLVDLPDQQFHQRCGRQLDNDLVDDTASAALQDLDADHIPRAAPIRLATWPRAPGRSGSQTRTRYLTGVAVSSIRQP